MAAFLTPEPAAYRYAPYIEELHGFFAAHQIYFGAPADLTHLVERIDDPGLFHEELRTLVRSILARESDAASRADLLELLAIAVGGPLIYRSAYEVEQPISRLLDFVDGVLRRPWILGTPGELVAFPAADGPATTASPAEKLPTSGSPLAQAIESRFSFLSRSAIRSLRPLSPIAPSLRVPAIVGATALLIVVLALVFHPKSSSPGNIRPVPVKAATQTPTHRPKPTPYGEAFTPLRPQNLRTRPSSAARDSQPAPQQGATVESSPQ